MDELTGWVEQLGVELGLGRVPIADRGVYAFRLASGIELTVEISRDHETLFLHAPLAPVPADASAQVAFYELLLVENHVGEAYHSRALAIDELRDEAVVHRALRAGEAAGYEAFARAVAAFAREAEDLRETLDGLDLPAATASRPDARPEDPIWLHSRFVRA